MNIQDFRRLARKKRLTAIIISDGCRDYLVDIHSEHGAGALTDRKGRRLRFGSLDQAKRAIKAAANIQLAMRVAADEACGGDTPNQSPFSLLAVKAA